MTNLTIDIQGISCSDEQFFQLCQKNRDLKFELSARRDLIIMPPTGGETGNRNIEIAYQLQKWSRNNQRGIAFDSSTGFKLPNSAHRSPDASWLRLEKWQSLTPSQQQKFLPFAPDFVIELLSPSDNLKETQNKMIEYIENGTQLGWLINRQNKEIEVYYQDKSKEILQQPKNISGGDILPDFTLDLQFIW
ncbi:MAG: Uma2 family endonuclease [Cyanobacterium sp. T60_A2020_053]|nr:Uma2 family endonuclease [Cyanobacterium sp. T60_A2020_053]